MTRYLPLLLIIAVLAAGPQPAHAQQGELISRVNSLRSSLGLAPYAPNNALAAAAAQHAQWIIDSQQVSHTQSNGSTPRTRAANAGYASQFVSENIYGGTNATADTAWSFWLNSPIHYRGLTNPSYDEIGVGVAYGDWGNAFVLVFGNADGNFSVPATGRSTNVSSSGEAAQAGPPPPPSYVVGVDALGYLMHEIQPGDTLGDIALQYGYGWDDLPYMMDVNDVDERGAFELKVGGVFLVPPYEGTYTPTPGGPPPSGTPAPDSETGGSVNVGIITSTPNPTEAPAVNVGIITSTPQPTTTPTLASTLAEEPRPSPQAVAQAQVPPQTAVATASSQAGLFSGRSLWLIVGIGLQVIFVVGAGIDLVVRRFRR